jgi:hypothetical protein
MIHVGLCEKDKAINCLESAFKRKENITFLARMFYENYLGSDLLSNDKRFIKLQKKIGLE